MTSKLAPILNLEVLRIAKKENKTDEHSMALLMKELADLCGGGVRQFYRYRSGRTLLPADYVDVLCHRFGSNVLRDEVNRTRAHVDVPDEYDIANLACEAVRDDLDAYQKFLTAFEDGVVQPGELQELRECGARIHRNVHVMLEIAEGDCARRQQIEVARKGSVPAKQNSRFQISHSRDRKVSVR
jgi:hypothetical protein